MMSRSKNESIPNLGVAEVVKLVVVVVVVLLV